MSMDTNMTGVADALNRVPFCGTRATQRVELHRTRDETRALRASRYVCDEHAKAIPAACLLLGVELRWAQAFLPSQCGDGYDNESGTQVTAPSGPEAMGFEEAREQIAQWIADGLPSGMTLPSLQASDQIWVHVADPNSVTVWAIALGTQVSIRHSMVRTILVRPIALRGWILFVWCDKPVVPANMRIEVTK